MEDDTIKLLRECNAGIKMGISSINDVLDHVRDDRLKQLLIDTKETHCKLESRTLDLLKDYKDDGKEPAAMAKMMSWIKTNVKLGGEDSDRIVADLMTDGCNMGVKSLYRYLHQYPAADETSKEIANQTIVVEEAITKSLQYYL
ncbi:MAG: hypothetical protein GX567_12375 [Clostridia bacterium]|nr:hypothetical protein [Clostridia bacterium]